MAADILLDNVAQERYSILVFSCQNSVVGKFILKDI